MKFLALVLVFSLIFQTAGRVVWADGASQPTLKAAPYLDNCEAALALFEKHKDRTVEKKFVALADTPEKMLQLIYDYNILFSRDFAKALLTQLQQDGIIATGSIHDQFEKLQKLSQQPPEELDAYVWKVLDIASDLSANQNSNSAGQVRYIQIKNLIEALKGSPHRSLFEGIARLALQSSLIAYAKEFVGTRDWTNAHSTRVNKIGSWTGWTIFLLSLGTGLFVNLTDHTIDNPGPTFMGFLIGALARATINSILKENMRDKAAKSVNDQALKTFKVGPHKGTLDIVSNSILSFLKDESTNGVLSVQEGCTVNVCELSPVQLAYLGHVDVLELETLHKTLKEAMGGGSRGEISKLDEAARAARENPGNYTKQMLLNRALISFLDKVSALSKARVSAAEALASYFSAVSQHTQFLLNEKPYKEKPLTDEGIFKNHLLLTKIQNDMAHVEEMKLDTNAIERKLQKSERTIEKLKVLLQQLPSGPSGWKEAAEQIISDLDELR